MRNRFYSTLTFLLLSIYSYAQNYSSYYIRANVNSRVDANINHNVSGVVYENKTITNIDYGALALANAQIEKNKIDDN